MVEDEYEVYMDEFLRYSQEDIRTCIAHSQNDLKACIDIIDEVCLSLETPAGNGDSTAFKCMEALLQVRKKLWYTDNNSHKKKNLNKKLTKALLKG
jgi:hypothetical protein|tara:strand:+ start:18378 stop:18665 length:288 start_codon:yes stop_codon:yes gene_type:complete